MAIGAILAVAGGLISAFGQKKSGDAAKKAGEANARVIAERTAVKSLVSERNALKVLGGGRADIGASGIQIAGSAADIMREGARDAAFELSSIQKQGELERKAALAGGASAQTAGDVAAVGSIIGGVTKAATLGLFG